MATPAELTGWYAFTHPNGAFDVCLRPGGSFLAPRFQANARWAVTADGTLQIAWGKYGNYELSVANAEAREFSGSLIGDAAEWRRMKMTRPLVQTELALLGAPAGTGSEWEFVHAGGTFPVEFRGDGFSHFICRQYPAHAHWSLGGAAADELYINWGGYGEYELRLAPGGDFAEGCAKGDPANWRKMRFIRALDAAQAEVCNEHH
mmetsp:Transcript_57412/g.168096  ORF Transcript_57412/g.168096 Transcript_57412/m.168096 type:complete len:205 (-) Transcript_57412:105-719(-)